MILILEIFETESVYFGLEFDVESTITGIILQDIEYNEFIAWKLSVGFYY